VKRRGVLLLGHGSRDTRSNLEFENVVRAYADAHPEFEVTHGYIELAVPLFQDALCELARRVTDVTVLPLFLFAAGHVKNDIPLALAEARREFPDVPFLAAREFGVHASLIEIAFERVTAALGHNDTPSARTALLVVGRGSSDPNANAEFCKVVRLIAENAKFLHVQAAFIGVTEPSVERSLDDVARLRPERVIVLPYFLFAGRLLDKLALQVAAFAKTFPWIQSEVAGHLGADARLLTLLDDRLKQAHDGVAPLPCDTCKYRVGFAGRESEVGGLKALLYSVRHTLTHSQAAQHEHAHRPLKKHVLVCGNVDCAERGSLELIAAMRQHIKDGDRGRDIRVTRTSCMGRCGEGPTVAIYPDGVWYRGVAVTDAKDLVVDHLFGDRLVARLVDDIMH
jgi:sirohydrochlorin ferrochelatase/(2Fe-2S) ferredoxin